MELDYQAFFKQLNNQEIDYLIVGGLAVNLHGIPRMTYDIDLMVHLHHDRALLETAVTKHLDAGLKYVDSGHYEGEHWLATFW